MSDPSPNVVYDCNVFVQALINPSGPAGACLSKVRSREVRLFVSPYVLQEVREIHEKVPPKYGVTAGQTEELAHTLASLATVIIDIPEIYRHPIDPDDSQYINLAIVVQAPLVVSRDRHLLNLMDAGRKEGAEFKRLFPTLLILDPVEFLRELQPKPD